MDKNQKFVILDKMFTVESITRALYHYKVANHKLFRKQCIEGIFELIIDEEYIPAHKQERSNVQTMGLYYHVLYKKPKLKFWHSALFFEPKWKIVADTRPSSSDEAKMSEELRIDLYIVRKIVEYYLVRVKKFDGVPRNFYTERVTWE